MPLPTKFNTAAFSAAVAAIAALTTPAHAQDFAPAPGDVTLRTGPAAIIFDASGDFQVLGQDLVGADLTTSDGFTLSVEAEIYVVPEISLSVTMGIPPKSKVDGKGILAPVGRLGSVRYGLGAVLAKYHFNQSSRFQPFIGAGASHFVSFKETDGAVVDLEVDASWGPLVQAGAEYMITPQFGLYASASYSWLKTDGRGTFGVMPIEADVTLNPTALQGGVIYRF